MVWFDENHESLILDLNQNSFAQNLASFSESEESITIKLICQDKLIANLLLNAISPFAFKFQNINLRFGWLPEKDHDLTDVIDDECIFIGYQNYASSFEKVFKSNSCKISKSANDKSLHIAYQRHFGDHANPKSISLGELNEKIYHVDPLLRSVDGIFFYLDAIRRDESHVSDSFVSGIKIEQACQISRFAGMSLTNKMIYFNLGSNKIDKDNSEVVSLLLWYYLEGASNRNIETIDHKNNHTYMVNNPLFEQPVKFVRTNITGRWWYQHPENKYFVPCTEEDYISISEGKIPDSFLLEDAG